MNDSLTKLASMIMKAKCIIALTGAGISTPSGIPDFRGINGLWTRLNPDNCTGSGFEADPDTVWGCVMEIYQYVRDAAPNAAHYALTEMERMGKLCGIITQNIDMLHEKAGSSNVVPLHGRLDTAICPKCGAILPITTAISSWRTGFTPICPKCGATLKPNIVLFNEDVPRQEYIKAFYMARNTDLLLVLGTSLAVAPANELPLIVKKHGGSMAIINDSSTELDDLADVVIRMRVEDAMPQLIRIIKQMQETH